MNEVVATTPAITSLTQAYAALMSSRPGILAGETGGELAWLHTAREREARRWQAEGLPTRRTERWKYTSLAPLSGAQIVVPSAVDVAQAKALLVTLPALGEAEALLVFHNGLLVRELSHFADDCVSVLSAVFRDAVQNGWSKERRAKLANFRAHLESSDADRETVFAAINTSFLQDAVLIHVPANRVVERPITVVNLVSAGAQTAMACPRIFAHLERGAVAALLEVYAGEGAGLMNAVSDWRLDENAHLTTARLQLHGAETTHVGATRIRQKRDSVSESYQFSMGALLSREDLHISLLGENASAVLDGLYLGRGRQHTDHYTLVEHLVPHTTSAQLYKGVLDGSARGVFNGHVRIHKDAQKSAAEQSNKNLLLSREAEIDTKPELEIEADDVKAAHGATIGRLDPEQEFYLQARAISKVEAQRMLALGFAEDVALRVRHPYLGPVVRKAVEQKFAKLEIGGARG